jgi:cytosine/adenosine deaminase-related metal-dependent hydrolase
VHRIDAKFLIPSGGEAPILDATIVFEGNRILHVGKTAAVPSIYRHLDPTSVPCVMPGPWDAHCHFHGIRRSVSKAC